MSFYSYKAGTIALTNGSTAVVGTSTLWSAAVTDGDQLWVMGSGTDWHPYEIQVNSDTSITLDRAYSGTTGSALAYMILRSSVQRDSYSAVSKQLSDFLATYRSLISVSGSDRYFTLDKTLSTDNAGLWFKQGGTSMIRAGLFGDNDFEVQYLVSSTWTKAIGIASASGQVAIGNAIDATATNAASLTLAGGLGVLKKAMFGDAVQLANGTVLLPALSFVSDADSGLYRIGANNIGIGVNGAKVLDIGTAGLAVIGTLSATGAFTAAAINASGVVTSTELILNASGYNYQRIITQNSGTAIWSFGLRADANFYLFREGGTGTVQIPYGAVIIGDGSPATSPTSGALQIQYGGLGVVGAAFFGGTVNAAAGFSSSYSIPFNFECSSSYAPQAWFTNSASDGTAGYLMLQKKRGSGAAANSDTVGNINFAGYDGTNYYSASFFGQILGAVSAGVVPIGFIWRTYNASGVNDERMRLSPSGGVFIGNAGTDPGVNNLMVQGKIGATQASPTSSGTGTTGQVCWDASYVYVCTSTNTWKRAAVTGGY